MFSIQCGWWLLSGAKSCKTVGDRLFCDCDGAAQQYATYSARVRRQRRPAQTILVRRHKAPAADKTNLDSRTTAPL